MLKKIKNNFRINTRLHMVLCMFIFLFSQVIFAQEKKITGVVVDSKSMPIPGVNVLVKSTGANAVTDIDGNFDIKVEDQNSELEFSSIGFKTLKQKVGNSSTLQIVLNDDSQELEEVVVVGYTTQKKKDLTGAVSSVKMSTIKDLSTSGISSALQGHMSGVTVLQSNGAPGAGTAIRIRGIGTLNNSEPLYVIDGMPADNMNDLNPSDIERIDVLKDAASAAIYGSRAANGVVIIQTKKGSEGKSTISFNTYYGFASPIKKINLLDAEQRNMIHQEAYANDGNTAPAYYTSDYAKVTRTNWQDEVFTNSAVQKNYDLSFSGGSKTIRYNLGFANLGQEGILKNTGYDRTTFRINTEMDIAKGLKIGENMMITNSTKKDVLDSGFAGAISSALKFDPSIPVYDENGAYSGSGELATDYINPVAVVERSDIKHHAKRIFGDVYAEYKFLNDFTFKTDFGYDWRDNRDKEFYTRRPEAGRTTLQNELIERYNESTRVMNTTTLKYTKNIDKHNIMALLGASYEDYQELNGNQSLGGFVSEDAAQRYASAATRINYVDGIKTDWALGSFFSRVDYDFDGKYLLSASFRADGSSKFAEANRWGYFPSASFGWRISNESFFENAKTYVQNLKFRASYGSLGNQNIYSNYPTKPSISNTTDNDGYYVVFGSGETATIGRFESTIPNENLKWEVTTQANVGLDINFLNDFDLTLDFYDKKTSDVLLQVPIPSLPGVRNNPWVNAADVDNKGFEANLNYRTKINELSINVYGNFSHVKNEVTSLGQEGVSAIYLNSYNGQNITRTTVGEPINHFYGYKTGDLFRTQADIDNYVNSKGDKIQPNAQVGDMKFMDLNNDGQLNDKDKANLGDGFPDFSYGFGSELAYKGFDFSFFFQGTSGKEIFDATLYEGDFVNSKYNQFASILDRYNPSNTNGSVPRATISDRNDNKRFSDYYVKNGDYLRLKNVILGYSLDKGLLEKIHVTKLRLYVNLQNYLTFTDYKGFDPDIIESGVNVGQFPQPKTFLMGLNVNF